MEDLSDATLVARALAGAESAFDALYRRHAPAVARRLRRVLGGVAETEDLLQTTFLEVYRTLARYRHDASFAGWVHAIAFRVVGTYLRSKRRRAWLTLDEPTLVASASPEPSADERAYHRQLAARMRQAIAALPPDKQIAFTLHELEGLGVTEIGELVGVSPQTAWARVESARRDVQKAMRALERAGEVVA